MKRNSTNGTNLGRAMARVISGTRTLASAAGLAKGMSRTTGAAVLAAAMAAAMSTAVIAGPEDYQVVVGNVTFTRQGNMWIITASDGAIINYASFDILPFETVQFIQPSNLSTVLNRINSAAPTRIDGTLLANGNVYFVNPAGVIFGNNAVVNVGGLFAAAGNISNEDFLAGRNNFTNLQGVVRNEGSIRADLVAMVGKQVQNYGTIVSPNGTVVMAAGEEVFVGKEGSQVFTRIQGPAGGDAQNASVENSGTIDAGRGRILMAAGDTAGMAIFNAGRMRARQVDVEGRGTGEVRIAGEIDATNDNGTGGRVHITGERVGVFGATIDASGSHGGGEIAIGGGPGGEGTERRADYVYVDQHSTISADATTVGNGGQITFWGTQAARVGGQIFARGGVQGGDGGFIETSGGYISLGNVPNMGARHASGRGGLWMIDPYNIRIVAGGATGDFGDANNPYDNPGVNDSQLGVNAIITALGLGDVVIQTGNLADGGLQPGNITFETSLSYSGAARTLTLNAHNDITFSPGVTVTGSGGGLSLVLNADLDNNGSGNVDIGNASFLLGNGSFSVTSNVENFTSSAGGVILANGNMSLANTGTTTLASLVVLSGGSLSIAGTDVTISGDVSTSGGSIGINNSGTSTISGSLATGAGNITIASAGGITTSGSLSGNTLSLSSAADVTIGRNVTATGTLSITAGSDGTGDLTIGTSQTVTLSGLNVALLAGVGGGGNITFSQATNFAGGPVTMSAGTGTIAVNAAVSFGANNASFIADEIDLAANVSGTGTLTLRTATNANSIELGGAGGTGALDLTAAELAFLQDGFSGITIGASGMTGTITVAGASAFNDNLTLRTAAGGSTSLAADLSSTGTVTFNSRVDVAAASIVSGSAVTFLNTVDGGSDLTVTSAGLVDFQQAVGGSTALTSLTVNGGGTAQFAANVTTTGAQTYANAVTLAGNITFTGNTIAFNSTVDADAAGNNRDLTINDAGTTTFGGAVGATQAINTLTTDAAGTTAIAADITTQGDQTFNDAVVLNADTTLTGVNITFASTVDADLAANNRALTVNASGVTTFTGAVGATQELGSLTTDAAGSTVVTANVSTTGNQTFNDALTLAGDVTFASSGGGNITFDSTVDSDGTQRSMTVNTSGDTTFNDIVGGTSVLANLTTDAGGTTFINGGVVRTSNTQSYGDAVTFGADTTLAAEDLDFAGNVSGTGFSLTITTFGGATGIELGGAGGTANLDLTAAELALFQDGFSMITFGDSSYIGTITVASNLSFLDALTFAVDGAGGGLIALAGNLSVTDATNAATINFGGPVRLDADVTVASAGTGANGDITFSDTVEADAAGNNRALTVNTAGTTTFASTVGATQSLGSLTTDTGGSTVLTGNVTTSGTQAYGDDVVLAADVNLTGNGISFAANLDGDTADTRSLTITDAGATSFGTGVGATARLNNLTVTGGGTVTIGTNISTAGNQTYDNAVLIDGDRTLTGVDVTFNSTLDANTAGDDLTINASGVTTFQTVGGTTQLGNLTTDSAGTVVFNGNVSTLGRQQYGDAATFNTAATLTASDFLFGSTLDTNGTAHDLTLNATGTPTINNPLFRFANSIGATNAFGDINIGAALGSVVPFSTIIFATEFGANGLPVASSVNPFQTFSINGNNVNIGQFHKVTALGSILINATTQVTLGDLNALRNITINSPTINLLMRAPSTYITALGTTAQDLGVDWVAGGSITTSGAITEVGAGGTFTIGFGTGAFGTVNGTPGKKLFINLTSFLDLGAGGNGSGFALALDLSPQQTISQPPIAGLNPRIEIDAVSTPTPVEGELAEFLRNLGIPLSGEPTVEDQLDALIGRSLYNDVANPNPYAADDRYPSGPYRVSRERLSLEVVQPVIDTYRAIFMKQDGQNDDGSTIWSDDSARVKSDLGKAWNNYKAAATKTDGLGFRLFLENDPGNPESAAALDTLNALRMLFQQIDQIGLSEFETRRPKSVIIGKALPDEIGADAAARATLMDAIMGEQPILPPEVEPMAFAQ